MPCGPFTPWSPIPPGSQLCAKVSSQGDDFVAMVRVVPAVGPETRLGTNALINGPTCVPLKNRGYGVAGVVTIGPEKPSVTLEISLKGPNGNTLKQCQWTFAKQGTFHVMVALIP